MKYSNQEWSVSIWKILQELQILLWTSSLKSARNTLSLVNWVALGMCGLARNVVRVLLPLHKWGSGTMSSAALHLWRSTFARSASSTRLPPDQKVSWILLLEYCHIYFKLTFHANYCTEGLMNRARISSSYDINSFYICLLISFEHVEEFDWKLPFTVT